MNTQHSFIAERAAAQHCAELLRTGPGPAELVPALTRSGERIARAFAPSLAMLLSGDDPAVSVVPAEQIDEAELAAEIGPLAANSLIGSATSGLALLASIEGQAMLRLVDRAFGGKGETTEPLPDRFPLSAELMIQRLDEIVSASLAQALGLDGLSSLRRDSSLADLAPFPPGTQLALLRIEVAEAGRTPWKVLIATPMAHLPALLGSSPIQERAAHRAGPADPVAPPFADMPLPLTATLVDMRVPLSTLAALEPGAVLPVAVARAVPVMVGSAVLARGTIGTADDRVAVKLTQIA